MTGWDETHTLFTDADGYVYNAEAAIMAGIATPIDPVCAIHGKRKSEHQCLYCCLCFKSLEPDECAYRPNGDREDVCIPCAEGERAEMVALAQAAVAAGIRPSQQPPRPVSTPQTSPRP